MFYDCYRNHVILKYNYLCHMEQLSMSLAKIKKLPATELNKCCLNFGINLSWPKSVKIHAVCQCMGISTTGTSNIPDLTPPAHINETQIDDYLGLSLKVLYGLTGWTEDLKQLPAIDDSMVKQYLLQMQCLDDISSRSYKLTRPYQLKDFIHSVYFNSLPSSSLCVIRAMCNPSQSTNKDDVKLVHVILDKSTGKPYGGYCTCTIGYVLI